MRITGLGTNTSVVCNTQKQKIQQGTYSPVISKEIVTSQINFTSKNGIARKYGTKLFNKKIAFNAKDWMILKKLIPYWLKPNITKEVIKSPVLDYDIIYRNGTKIGRIDRHSDNNIHYITAFNPIDGIKTLEAGFIHQHETGQTILRVKSTQRWKDQFNGVKKTTYYKDNGKEEGTPIIQEIHIPKPIDTKNNQNEIGKSFPNKKGKNKKQNAA